MSPTVSSLRNDHDDEEAVDRSSEHRGITIRMDLKGTTPSSQTGRQKEPGAQRKQLEHFLCN